MQFALRHHRFELVFVGLLGVVVSAAAIAVSISLRSVGLTPQCVANWLDNGPSGAAECEPFVRQFADLNQTFADPLLVVTTFVSFVVGLILGVPLVARELETRTASLAWWIAASRTRWLTVQLATLGAVVLPIVTLVALSASFLSDARLVWTASPFTDTLATGLPVIARGLAAFAVSVTIGAIVGRQLPGVTMAIVAFLLLLAVSNWIEDSWLESRVRVVYAGEDAPPATLAVTRLEPAWLDPAGPFVRVGESVNGEQAPPPGPPAAGWLADHPGWAPVWIGVPASETGGLAIVDSAFYFGVAVIAAGVAYPVVHARRVG